MNTYEVRGLWKNAEQVFMYTLIQQREAERAEGREDELVTTFPSLTSMNCKIMLGSFSWATLGGKKRWVQAKHAITDRGAVMTPGDIARSYLNIKFPKWRGRVTTNQYREVVAKKRSHPLFAQPGTYEDMIYVDLRSAYWSIMQVVGWNVDYFPKKWIAAGEELTDFPFPENKLARNCLVTTALPSNGQMWDGSNIVLVKSRKPFVNLVLWSCIMDVLHGVAWEMRRLGAVYVHTDGYIISKTKEYLVDELFDSWGLPYSVKGEGRAVVHGAGDYDMPHHQSRLKRLREFPFNNLHDPGIDWLRPRIKRLASVRLQREDGGRYVLT